MRNCSQTYKEKDWLVRKFQVKHALKAADQWNYVTGTANPEGFLFTGQKYCLQGNEL